GVELSPGTPMTLAIWSAAAATAILFWQPGPLAALRRLVLREAPLAAQAMGIDAARWRLAAFAFAAGCGGLAGGFYVHGTGVAAPDIADFGIAVNALAITVIGGRGRVGGAVLGAVLLAFLPEALRFLGGWQLFAWGGAMLAMLILAPDGLAGLLQRSFTNSPGIPDRTPVNSRIALGQAGTLSGTRLRKNFGGVTAVDDISMDVRPGEIVGLIGGNGAGKTTLLNLLTGFETPDTGSIVWRGGDVTTLDTSRRARLGIGRSFQIDQLPGTLTALDAVAAAVWQTGSLPAARVAASTLLQQMGLGERCAEPLDTLPPATRRLVDIARALAASPGVLLLDEPTAGLSATERDGLGRTLATLREQGLGMAIVEHDLAFLLPLVDRLVCLRDGRIVAEGTPDDLASRPDLRDFFAGYRGTP
ncbi:MAG: ATP-binding cassette domain-containing protein, partial [Reyranellaceae bacterium]